MGWNNYNNNRRNNSYNPNRGGNYNSGGYHPHNIYQDDNTPSPNIPFYIGQLVRHKATNTTLSVVRIGREQVECRLPDLSSNWFYVHELEAISEQE